MSNVNVNELFIKAARKKFRFEVARGLITVEDLFDLSLEALDKVAVNVSNKIDAANGKSFISKRSASTADLDAQLEILKFVIETKQKEAEEKKERAEKAKRKEFLEELLAKKKADQLGSLSVEEIEKQLAEIS